MKKNIPNILTMLRFVLIPFILYFLSIDNYILTFVFLTLSGITGALVLKNIIPLWILGLLVLKEFVMIAGASFLYGKELVVSSKWYGKLATVLIYVAIVCSLVIKQFSLPFKFDTYIYYLAIISTIFSLIMYIKAFFMQGYLKKNK